MRFQETRQAVISRLRHPGYWVAGLAVLLLTSVPVVVGPRPYAFKAALRLLPFGFWAVLGLTLFPTPWQWSGDGRPLTGWARGLLQSLLFALAYPCLLLLLLAFMPASSVSMLFGLGLGVALLVMLPLGYIVARAEDHSEATRKAQARAREVQWMSHRGAFSPSLLLGNLGHLADLAEHDARATERGLVDLAALYRQWLVEAEKPMVSWATERDLADRFLDLEGRRWGGHLRIRWHLDADADRGLVPPLLLLPLLEIALSQGPQTGEVDLELGGRPLPEGLEVWMKVQTPAPEPGAEVLAALGRRLRSEGGRLEVRSWTEGWEAHFFIPGDRP